MSFEVKNKLFDLDKYIPLFSFSLFVVILIIGYFIINPVYSKVKAQDAEIKENSAKLEARRANLEKIKDLSITFPDFTEKVDLLDEISVAQADADQVLAQMEKIAKASKVKLDSFNPTVSQVNRFEGASVQISGNYNNFRNFLTGLENNQLLINLELLVVSGRGNNMTFSLAIKTGS